MSGIVGVVNDAGLPADRRLLAAMTAALRFRGPDAERLWTDGTVGLGHTLLAATDEAVHEVQPRTLDGTAWIVADARIDDRDGLRRRLRASTAADLGAATDDELILRAYHAWGAASVDHLIGDFAFAIWDTTARRLFCARDHFGVKPFYYASTPRSFVFSNTLDVVRQHPDVPADLDDLWIADYLLFNRSMRYDATAFRGVRRLPAGHILIWTAGDLTVRPYWTPSVPDEVRYRTAQEYVDRFRDLFGDAVRDRLRTRRVAVSLSGGLDSPFVAATAKAELQKRDGAFTVVGHTMVYDHLVPDEERAYTTIAADAIGIPVRFLAADDYEPFAGCTNASWWTPEPIDASYRGMYLDYWQALAADARVAFTGSDADGLLNELIHDRFHFMARERRFDLLARDVKAYVSAFGRRPPVGLRALLRKASPRVPAFPMWLEPDLVGRLDLRARWRDYWTDRAVAGGLRPRAIRTIPVWSQVFESLDAQMTRQALEFRHPFADKRVTDYLLAIPAVPWCTAKRLLALAAEGVLPERIRGRAKSPLRESPMVAHLRRAATGRIESFRTALELERYVNRRLVPPISGGSVADAVHAHVRPFVLNVWLLSVTGALHEESVDIQPCA